MLPTADAVEIRQLSKLSDFATVVQLQRQIWGFDDLDLLPLRLFVVADKIGGQVLGAFEGETMVAFCLCIPGLKPNGKNYLHSHMLGVLPAYRNSGVGRELKLRQREYAMAAGIDLIEWTFDPLELKNAFFNIERLGAIIRRYVHNQYGNTSSHLHGGLPTDRLVPEWWICSPQVKNLMIGQKQHGRAAIEARISIPNTIGEMRSAEPEQARAVQAEAAEQFNQCFRDGLAVVGFERGSDAGTYLLAKWE